MRSDKSRNSFSLCRARPFLASAASDGTVHVYTREGWVPTDWTRQALAGPRWRHISASEAVAVQRAITFGPGGGR